MLSRVADSLYWMSRFLERAENTARSLDVHLNLVLELSPQVGQRRYLDVLNSLQIPIPEGPPPSSTDIALNASMPESISSCIGGARENARQIREQISSEMFEQLNRLFLYVRSASTREQFAIEPHSVFRKVKDGAHLFQGITDSTMSHGQGWQWIQAGRYLERADLVAGILLNHMKHGVDIKDVDPHHYSELLGILKNCTAWEAYCKVHGAELTDKNVAEFLLLNGDFPHSLYFCVKQLSVTLNALAQLTGMTAQKTLEDKIGRIQARLRYSKLEEFSGTSLAEFLLEVRREMHLSHVRLYEIYLSHSFSRS